MLAGLRQPLAGQARQGLLSINGSGEKRLTLRELLLERGSRNAQRGEKVAGAGYCPWDNAPLIGLARQISRPAAAGTRRWGTTGVQRFQYRIKRHGKAEGKNPRRAGAP